MLFISIQIELEREKEIKECLSNQGNEEISELLEN